MSMDVAKTPLMVYLKACDDVYYGKVLELRGAIQGWLNYIPQTFPHCTRHTVEHSDEIVLQMSKLLFRDDDPTNPVVRLSATESYIVIAAAYLHDAGMVASDREKMGIFESGEWRDWVAGTGGGAERWPAVQNLRRGTDPPDEGLRNFLADVQTRFLLAEFIRRTHHLRAADVIAQHQGTLGRFAFDDPLLLRTISDVCLAHGLRHHELEDRDRYPERRDIRGQLVNVRFLAMLLRLGDLLDMSCDRACPLLLNLASPMPAESLAHWTQYQRITHRLTCPDRIELVAECRTQDEHRFLLDWCQWLVREVRNAGTLMARALRHSDWEPPTAELEGSSPTIIVRPAVGATYIFSEWRFELDNDVVFHRLIHDVYDSPNAYVRELIQNALDASRCQMCLDLIRDGLEVPEYPTQVNEERRRRYPVKVTLSAVSMKNACSGEDENRQVLTVEDSGIGMDRDVIQKYFLQVGRSYYTTEEFRRKFGFVAASRFGVGFLSVFAASDHVTVETCKPSSASQDGPIRLTLTGPRNYLLTESGDLETNGTRVDVVLRKPMQHGDLTSLVSGWCRRVEFPVVVDDLGTISRIESERAEQFTYERAVVHKEGEKSAVRAFPVKGAGIEGEIYIFAYDDGKGERWDKWGWAKYIYPKEHPGAVTPEFPETIICLHGISALSFDRGSPGVRLDYRGNTAFPTLSRRSVTPRGAAVGLDDPAVVSRLEEILREHLDSSPHAKGQDAWVYRQDLVQAFKEATFWESYPDTIQMFVKGQPVLASLLQVLSTPTLTTVADISKAGYIRFFISSLVGKAKDDYEPDQLDNPTLTYEDVHHLSDDHRERIFRNRSSSNVRWLTFKDLAIDWVPCTEEGPLFAEYESCPISLADLPGGELIGLPIHPTLRSYTEHLLLN
jgi:hypothetical protein